MQEVLQTLVRGLGFGSLYAMLAVSFVIIYKSSKVISFAQPALMLAGATLVSYLAGPVGFYLAVPLAAVAIAGLGLVIERTTIRPMIGRPVFVIAIITLGLDVVIRVVVNVAIGRDVRQVGDPWGLSTVDILGITVQQRFIAMILVLIAVTAALFAFFRYSRWGLAMRAASLDQETALVQGVSVGGVMAMSWAMAEALAANGFRLEEYREGRFSSSWWQAVRSDRRPRPLDLALRAVFAVYDLVPFRKDVMVLRATRVETV